MYYNLLLSLHSFLRWLVVLMLLYTISKACIGYIKKLTYTKTDNALRHWTATTAHIQLIIGMILYFKSPMVKHFNTSEDNINGEPIFFAVLHIALMLTSIFLITIGSAIAKRKNTDSAKFKSTAIYFTIGIIIVFIAIPWPFSPFASRPLIRY